MQSSFGVCIRRFVIYLVIGGGALNLTSGRLSAQTGGASLIHPSVGARSSIGRSSSLKAPAVVAGAAFPAAWIYHNGEKLVCPDCHTMHASQQHPFSPSDPADAFGSFPQTFAPSGYLLKTTDPITLCLTCHEGRTGIPDVVNADSNGLTERSAGFFDAVDIANYRGHNLKSGLSSKPTDLCMRCHFGGGPHGGGSFATAGVTCIDCHEVHGNGRVRNLRWASYPGYEPAAFGLFMSNGALGNLSRYEADNIGYGSDNTSNIREVTNMCLDCHHVFSGPAYTDRDGNSVHERHSTYDSERGSINSIAQGGTKQRTDPTHWQNGTGAGFVNTPRLRFITSGATDFAASRLIDATKNGVFCLSCHKAHGSQNAFSLTWNPLGPTATDGCEQCHNKTAQ
jgi:predicted CXXCH cytochrome family protein